MNILGLSQRPIELIAAIGINGNAKLRQTCYCIYQALALNQTSHLSDEEIGSELLLNASHKGYDNVVVTILRERSHIVDAHNNNGWTPLNYASLYGHESTVKLLLEYGSDVNGKDKYGLTALMYASRYGQESVVKLLLDHGADVNLQNNSGYTALMWASLYGHESIVKLLKANGATS